jgi:aminoglycoside phosphotransferase (APT) family kinase protein
VGYEHIETGNRKRTLRVRFADGPALALQYVPDGEACLLEATLRRALAERTDVSLAPLVASGRFEGGSYLLAEWVDAPSAHRLITGFDPPTRRRFARAFGRHLGTVHASFAFEGFGRVSGPTGTLSVDEAEPDWRVAFCGLLDEGLHAMGSPLDELEAAIETTIEATLGAVPRDPTPRLFPWDYRPGNVLAEKGRPVAVLDWEAPWSAHREFSLAKAEFLLADWYGFESNTNDRGRIEFGDDRRMLAEAFYAGYERECAVPAAYWSERRRPYRLCAIVRAAIDSNGRVTRPGYPMVDRPTAIAFHRNRLRALIGE